MCFSKELSIKSFIFGLISGLLLIFFGNDKSKNTNKAIGIFFIFVSFMQLIEYFIWEDIDCKNGLNKFSFGLGPMLNHLQPIIFFLLCSVFIESSNLFPQEFIIFLIIIYVIYIINKYYDYIINNPNKCVYTNKEGHLDWPWKYNFNYIYFILIELIIFSNYYKNKNLMISFLISYLLLFLSNHKFNKNSGELWCFMVTGIPLINLFLQKILNIDN